MSPSVTPSAIRTRTAAAERRFRPAGRVVVACTCLLISAILCSACTASPGARLSAAALRIAKALVREVDVACGNSCQPAEQAQNLVNVATGSGPDVIAADLGQFEWGWDRTASVTLQLNPSVDTGGFDSGTTSDVRCIEVTLLPLDASHGTSVHATYAPVDCPG